MSKETNFDKFWELAAKKKLLIPLSLLGLLITMVGIVYTVNKINQQPAETSPPVTSTSTIKAVTALGRIEPYGEAIQLSPPPDIGGTRIGKLLVKEGDWLAKDQTIAILDNYDRTLADVELAQQEIKVAQANLAVVKAGAKTGEIKAQAAAIARLKAQLNGEIAANKAEIARLEAQLFTETAEREATISRWQAELRNAEREFQRYQKLAQEGVISESELDSRSLSVETAKERVTEAQATYNKTLTTLREEINQAKAVDIQEINTLQKQITEATATLERIAEVRDVDVEVAQAEVGRSIAKLRQAEESLKLTQVKAPTDGQIIKINAYPGELVSEDKGVVEFGRTNQMVVVAEVYESDISKVRLGQQAIITSESGAFEGEVRGVVSHIGLYIGKQDVLDTDPAADVDSRVVEVEIKVNQDDSDRVAHLTNSKAIVKIML
ncbi:MAG: ABC exporter membrane fusion protein [Xenococcaceae cyanobacterium MO_188.B29]|nr:ABC exporter membrane fusion protein [Xenococcaceae cyanobacterium MO_188.B29]